jgi:hypothetical protein
MKTSAALMRNIYNALLLVIAAATQKEVARQVIPIRRSSFSSAKHLTRYSHCLCLGVLPISLVRCGPVESPPVACRTYVP